jgi:hypothetical protein
LAAQNPPLAPARMFLHPRVMNERVRIITEQALALPASEREQLCEALLISLQGGATEEDEARLREEVRRAGFASFRSCGRRSGRIFANAASSGFRIR